ncbi:MAG TPA: fibronectin type III domain-containing protein [Terriglobia bacterium]|nr:fibronectin type III domain-containing protein [Terriglobia bacterium]
MPDKVAKGHSRTILIVAGMLTLAAGMPLGISAQTRKSRLPDHVPPKRSSQIKNGFGINSDLPRDPYLPWSRWWWTRIFDAGVSWIRIGQYENSSEPTSWDWVEQKRGVYSISPEVEDYVNSLTDNGVKVQVQLLYGNPMYTSPAGRLPDAITPEPGSFHNDDRSLYSVFWPPKTPEQIEAFTNYVKWMVNHFRGRIHYYALWNEQDIGYWNPWGNPEEYGRLLKAFVPAVHETDPEAKVIYGGQADPTRDFTKRALDTCQCAAGIDVYAYHTYPGYGRNLNPETMDSGAYGKESPRALREIVRRYPGIRPDIEYWDDEFNSIGAWKGSDDSVQAKYIPRGMIYNWAAGVRTFVWLLTAGTDGNEFDDFGFIHGLRYRPDDFTPRAVFYSLQNTNALFSDTKFDPSIQIPTPDLAETHPAKGTPFLAYGFRSPKGKAIVAYWLAAHSEPGNKFPADRIGLKIVNSGIKHPVLIDIVSGEIKPLAWKEGTTDVLDSVPLLDSVLAITDEDYFDWPVLPESPSSLTVTAASGGAQLKWEIHGGNPSGIEVERQVAGDGADSAPWKKIAQLPGSTAEYSDTTAPPSSRVGYRVRASNDAGESAYSNIVRLTF